MASEPEFITPGPAADPVRAEARKRLEAKRSFSAHLTSYLVVNAFLILIWAITGRGYFWPVWVLGGWGIGLVMHYWEAFRRRRVTESDIDAEVRRLQGGS